MDRLYPPPDTDISFFDFFEMIFGDVPLVSVLLDVVQGLFGGNDSAQSPALEFMSGLFGIQHARLDNVEDSTYDLQTRTQALEGVIGYGSSRMSSNFTPGTSFARTPFNTKIGPSVGVTFGTGADAGIWFLGSKGLWEFSIKVIWDFLVGPVNKGCYMDLIVWTPARTEFYRSKNLFESSTEATQNETGRFVVPASGYLVTVHTQAGVNYREVLGATGYNQFNLLKISNETS